MKKLISVLLAFVLCITALPISALAEENNGGIDIDIDVSDLGTDTDYEGAFAEISSINSVSSAGKIVCVPVMLSAQDITTLKVEIDYPTDVLEIAEIIKTDIGEYSENPEDNANLAVDGQDPSQSPYALCWAYKYGVTYAGAIALVKFNVKSNAEAGDYEVNLNITEVADASIPAVDVEAGVHSASAVVTVTNRPQDYYTEEVLPAAFGEEIHRLFLVNPQYDQDGILVDFEDYRLVYGDGNKIMSLEAILDMPIMVYVKDGIADGTFNGLVYIDGTWYNIKENVVDVNTTPTLVYNIDAWYYVINGVVDFTYTGLVEFQGTEYYVQKGTLKWGVNGLVDINGTKYYLSNSSVYKGTTLTYYNGAWHYIKNGKVDYTATTLIYFNNDWYYVRNGKVDFSATTLIYFNNAWYYVKNGKVDFSATTLIYFNDGWYYVRNGKVDFSATTLIYFNDGWYYVRNGKVDFSATTLVYFNDGWYYVRNGKVDLGATTLVYFNDGWYYVKGGKVDFSATTLVYFNQNWYYVEKGKVNFNANLRFKFNGAYYNVVKGVVKF